MNEIQAGTYRARALEAQMGRAGTGREQVVIRFQIVEGDYTGQTIMYYGVFSEKTEKRVLRGMVACGWDGESRDLRGITANEVDIEVRRELDLSGVPRLKVAQIVTGGLAANPMSEAEQDGFLGRMAGKARKIKEEMAAHGAPQQDPADEFPY